MTALSALLAVSLVLAPPAGAQVGRSERSCLATFHRHLRGVALAVGAEIGRCVRAASSRGGSGGTGVRECVEGDERGRVAAAIRRGERAVGRRCAATPAPFGPSDVEAVSNAAVERGRDRLEAVFGADPDAALGASAGDGRQRRCQRAITRAVAGCHDAVLAAFGACAKRGVRDGSITDASGLAACVGSDPRAVAEKRCGRRVAAELRRRCPAPRVALGDAVPGCFTADASQAAGCLRRGALCEACRALEAADDLSLDCDALDDGVANASCEAGGCEVLNAAECLLPYPSTRLLVPAATDTGFRLALPQSGMPSVTGPAIDVAPYNQLDGFNPMVHPLMHFPQGVDLEASGASRLLAPGCCGQPPGPPWIDTRTFDGRSLEADSPSVLMDAATGERVLHFLEVDAHAEGPARQVVFLRPGASLAPGRRYVVAMRRLTAPGGAAVEPERAFAALRDGTPTTIAAIEERRPYMEREVFAVLAANGVARDDLVLAFDFVTRSERQLTHQQLSMRDQAYGWLAGVAADPDEAPFTVDRVETNDCGAPGAVVWRTVAGTLRSPLFLQEDPALGGVPWLNVDGGGEPVQNGFTNAAFAVSIPCTALDAGKTPHLLLLGHGFLGTGLGMVEGTADVIATAAEWNYVAGGTDWIGFSGGDVGWLIQNIVGSDGMSRLNNMPALVARVRQAMVNAIVLARVMKLGLFDRDPAFRLPGGEGAFAASSGEMFYDGVSLGGIMGLFLSALTPDIERFAVDVPTINFITCLTQRSSQFGAFSAVLEQVGLTDPMQGAIMLALESELFIGADGGGYARHVTRDPLPGSGAPKRILMLPAWLDKQVPNVCTEISARTLGLPSLEGSIQQGLQGIPDLPGPLDSALVTWDLGAFDLFDPAHQPFIPPLANVIPSGVCDPHGGRRRVPAGIVQLTTFLRPGGDIRNFCVGPGALCDGDDPSEIADGAAAPCDPLG